MTEKLWSEFKRVVNLHKLKNIMDLKKLCMEVWSKITLEMSITLVDTRGTDSFLFFPEKESVIYVRALIIKFVLNIFLFGEKRNYEARSHLTSQGKALHTVSPEYAPEPLWPWTFFYITH